VDEIKQFIAWIPGAIFGGLVFFMHRLLSRYDQRLDAHDTQLADKVSKAEFAEFKVENSKQIDGIKADLGRRLDTMEKNIIDIIKSRTGG
jgi:hypothetical protein